MLQSYSLWDSFQRNAQLHGDRAAFIFGDTELSHRQMVEHGCRVAGQLAALGASRGDRIAIIADARLEIFLLMAAAAQSGLILVPLNWRLNPGELARIINDCGPVATFVEPQYRHLVASGASGTLIELSENPTLVGETFPDLPDRPNNRAGHPVTADDPFLILYTAFVDGEPRGATISQGNLIASAVQMTLALKLDADDCFLGALPFFHMMAIALSLGVNYAGGRTVVRSRFEADDAVRLVAQHRITLFGTFPPMLAGLLDAAASGAGSLASVKHVMGLDTAATIERLGSLWPGATFWSIYGQTEAGGNVTYGRWRDCPGAAGRPAFLSRVAVVGEDDTLLAPGETGEIVIRGPGVFQGYWGRTADNLQVGRGGWHHTGDLGRFDDAGYLWYQGRAPHKELIKPGGENVYPGEVERVLCRHPAIRHAVVFGLPDPQWGEAVIAVCETHGDVNTHPDQEMLRSFVGEHLARYKRPKTVILVDRMPLTPHGVPDRAAVKQVHGAQ